MSATKEQMTQQRDRDRAVWYAFGREDAGERLVDPAEEFAAAYAEQGRQFRDGGTFMPSMKRAFRLWQEDKSLNEVL